MNRDIAQLIAVLAQMQSDVASARTGLAALAQEVAKLKAQITTADPIGLAREVTAAAATGAGMHVRRAADSAETASKAAERLDSAVARESKRRLRWKRLAIVLLAMVIFVAGCVAGRFTGIATASGCIAAGGQWVKQPTLIACVLT